MQLRPVVVRPREYLTWLVPRKKRAVIAIAKQNDDSPEYDAASYSQLLGIHGTRPSILAGG